MASLSVLKDATIPMDTSNWTQVNNKKTSANNRAKEKLEAMKSAMKKTKISIVIRIPNDAPDDYSVAEVHFATIREISKQDSNLIVLDSKGNNQINIHKSFGPDKYKETFLPRERNFNNGTVQVSIAHYILSEVESFSKTLLIPFLRKNKVFIYFNQRDGLEHFSAIGVLFGPHPEISWRQDTIERIEKLMKADITPEECESIKTNITDPKVVITMVPQQIANPKHSKTTSTALEIRVPAEYEKIYLNILNRLNERASTLDQGEVDITFDESMGIFFPYYAKRSRPQLFESLMRKQNTEMNATSAIPLFGLSPEALEYEVTDNNGNSRSVREWLFNHINVMGLETTASSKELGKYILVADREQKEEVETYVDEIFDLIPECENHSVPFKKPQRGGNPNKNNSTASIKNYLDKLEQRVQDELSMYDEDDLSTSPPPRPRRMTITYAQAAKRLSFQSDATKPSNEQNSGVTTSTSMSTLTQSTLDEAMEKIRNETTKSIEKLRSEMQKEIQNMEGNIASAVINALKSTPSVVHMEAESSEAASVQSTQDTTTTMKTMADKFETLTSIVQSLSERVLDLAEKQTIFQHQIMEKQDASQNKRTRPDLPTRKLAPSLNSARQQAQSPPSKQQRASTPTPPATPPPKGTQALAGPQEGK
jgi:hypothetical protein